jgi:hypothetical protein
MDDYESVLLVIRECFVYRIPPLGSSKGYKAAEWDVSSFLWSGRLRIVSIGGKKCYIKLEDANSGELFAQCEYREDNNSVEPVIDSSRYFVLRIEDQASGKHAYIGMGFQERSEAFDFNVALQDFTKHLKNENAPKVEYTGPKVDYSWKEGETININIGKLKKSASSTKNTLPSTTTQNQSTNPNDFVLLPPPPSNKISVTPPSSETSSQQDKKNEWADFGDFVGANNSNPSNWTTF